MDNINLLKIKKEIKKMNKRIDDLEFIIWEQLSNDAELLRRTNSLLATVTSKIDPLSKNIWF